MFFPLGCRSLIDGWRSGKFVGWHTARPSASGSNAYTANGAARLPIGTLTTAATASAGTGTNAGAIQSSAATAAWTRITHLGIWTSLTGGSIHAFAQLGSPVTLANGEKIRIAPGDLDITVPTS